MRANKTNFSLNASDLEVARVLGLGGSCHSAGTFNFLYSLFTIHHSLFTNHLSLFSSPSSLRRADCQPYIRTAFLFLLLLSPCQGGLRQSREGVDTLLLAIEQVESSGRTNAVGDGGRAVGCLQIHKIMVDDINRILGRREFFYRDRMDRKKSFIMAGIYLGHYGKGKTREQQARIWNGGPNGHKKQSTLQYAAKVTNVAQASRLRVNK
jgi:hypothetical protein